MVTLAPLAAATARAATAGPVRVVIIAPDMSGSVALHALESRLETSFGFQVERVTATAASNDSSLSGLRNADVAIVHRGPGTLSPEAAVAFRQFLTAGKGLVLLAATPDAWPSEPSFTQDVLGATPGGVFAAGSPLTIINLFPHPVLSGISRFDSNDPVPLYTKLADDAQMIMEGTVGEATTPLAWVRRRPAGNVVHFVFDPAQHLADTAYQQILGQAVLWTARHPIPGAPTTVQRTFMPEAYPGAFAITLPNGPGVCLDPVRGGINYIWAGDFVDLRPRWITKVGEPARIFGPVFYREKTWHPFRAGSPGTEPDFRFLGYTVRDGVPEFHYQIGGRDVHESFTSGADLNGLVRRFRVGSGAAPLWLNLEPQPEAEVIVRGLEHDGPLASFPSTAAGEFTIEIRPKARLP